MLAGRRLPKLNAYGELEHPPPAETGVHAFGQRHEFDRLVGRLRSNHDIVVIDVGFEEWFPQQNIGFGRWAIVGLEIADVPEDRYTRVRFQITNSDLFFGVAPIGNVTWPATKDPSEEATFSATLNASAHQVWDDAAQGIKFDCGYDNSYSFDQYHIGLVAAPVIDIYSTQPLTPDEWRDRWLQPLLGLAAFATKGPQTVSWLSVLVGEDREQRSGTVFSGGIDQAPYTANYNADWIRNPELLPIFTLATLPIELPRLVTRWRELQSSDNPFVELYGLTLFQRNLPARAKFLYLVQALEALHGFEHQAEDEQRAAEFKDRRKDVIDEAAAAGLSAESLKLLREQWSKRPLDSLDRRLTALLDELPTALREQLEANTELEPVRSELKNEGNAETLAAQIRVLRNHLSHGTRNYEDPALSPWVKTLETICRAHLLRLLGFAEFAIEESLRQPDPS